MILNAIDNLRKKLLPDISGLIQENLKTVKLIQMKGMEESMNMMFQETSISSIGDFLKMRVLDTLKDTSIVKKEILKDNKKMLDSIDSIINPFHREKIIREQYFNVEETNSKYLNVSNVNDVKQLIELSGEGSALRNTGTVKIHGNNPAYICAIKNPFNGVIVDSVIKKGSPNDWDRNRLFKSPEHKDSRKIDGFYEMELLLDTKEFKLSPTSLDTLNFEFVLYHELAHATFNQIDEGQSTAHEKHSDISSLIKMIKNHDMNEQDALSLCQSLVHFRTKGESEHFNYFEKSANSRIHFTESEILSFSIMIKNKLEDIKKLPDNEIPHFAEIFITENKKGYDILLKDKDNIPQESKEKLIKAIINENEVHIDASIKSFFYSKLSSVKVLGMLFTPKEFNYKNLYPEKLAETNNKYRDILTNNAMNNDEILKDIMLKNLVNKYGDEQEYLFDYLTIRYNNNKPMLADIVMLKYNEYKNKPYQDITIDPLTISKDIKLKLE